MEGGFNKSDLGAKDTNRKGTAAELNRYFKTRSVIQRYFSTQ